MNKERLQAVADVLRTVPDEAFAMETWWRSNCKSVGCAVGHYIHARPDCGLALAQMPGGTFVPTQQDDENWDAVMGHFDLTERQAHYLFDHFAYDGLSPSRAQVIDRIYDFVTSGGDVGDYGAEWEDHDDDDWGDGWEEYEDDD